MRLFMSLIFSRETVLRFNLVQELEAIMFFVCAFASRNK